VGKKIEVIAKSKQGILMHPHPVLSVQVSKDSPVLSQQPVNIPYKVVRIAIQPVIVIIPALIRTEFLISTATNGVAAIETFLFHSTNVFIKI
jgi:hypothetical protein